MNTEISDAVIFFFQLSRRPQFSFFYNIRQVAFAGMYRFFKSKPSFPVTIMLIAEIPIGKCIFSLISSSVISDFDRIKSRSSFKPFSSSVGFRPRSCVRGSILPVSRSSLSNRFTEDSLVPYALLSSDIFNPFSRASIIFFRTSMWSMLSPYCLFLFIISYGVIFLNCYIISVTDKGISPIRFFCFLYAKIENYSII
jgi:hypothetical protein